MNNLEALVRSAAAGNDRAFADIIRQFQDMAFGYAYSILGDLQLAEDAAQEAFVEACVNLKKLDDPSAFPGWFRRIVQFRSNRFLQRKQLPQAPLEEAVTKESKDPGPHELTIKREIEETVFAAVNSLSQPLRETTTLFYINGYSRKDIAGFLEISENTVRNRLSASRKELKRRLTMNGIIKETFGSNKPGDEFVRKVIEGVPNFWKEQTNNDTKNEISLPQFFVILTCICSSLESMGENYGQTGGIPGSTIPDFSRDIHNVIYRINNLYMYLYIMSGAAFRLVWRPGIWDFENAELQKISSNPVEPYRRLFEAVGYNYKIVGNENCKKRSEGSEIIKQFESEHALKNRITGSIRSGKPVIAFGSFDKYSVTLVTGYDESADVLITMSHHMEHELDRHGTSYDRSGLFCQPDWGSFTSGFLFIGDKKSKPSKPEAVYNTLKWAVQLMCHESDNGIKRGIEAYQPWMDALLDDESFPAEKSKHFYEPFWAHHAAMRTLWEGRFYASIFLKQAAEDRPELASDLKKGADIYQSIVELVQKGWSIIFPDGFDHRKMDIHKFMERENREKLISLIQQIRDKDKEAIGIIEKALKKW